MIDDELTQLALQAKSSPQNSRERLRAIQQMNRVVMRPGIIHAPAWMANLPPYVRDDIYQEALSQAFLEICCKIAQFDPQRASLISWLQFIFNKRCLDLHDQYQRKHRQDRLNDKIDQTLPAITPDSDILDIEELRQFLEEDPTGEFQKAHVRGCPTITYQTVALRRMNGESWEEIAASFNKTHSTLSNFFYKRTEQFLPVLRQHFGLSNDGILLY